MNSLSQYGLSSAQERLWMQEKLFPCKSALEVITGLRVFGVVDSRALESAARSLVRTHPAMRTRTTHQAGTVQQVEHDTHEVNIDIERLPLAALTEQLNRTATEGRTTLFQHFSDGDQHMILLRSHHLFTDGWSTGIQVSDFAAAYNMALRGHPVMIEPPGSSVREFVEFEQDYQNGGQLAEDELYWVDQMRKATTRTWPRDAMPRHRDFSAGVERIRLSPTLVRALEASASMRDLTLLTLFVESVRGALEELAGSTPNKLGLMVSGRNVPLDLVRVVGCFINTVPLVLDSGALIRPLENVQRVIDEAIAHSAYPYQRTLRLYRSMTGGLGEPVDVLINYQGSISSTQPEMDGTQCSVLSWEEIRPQAQYPLSIQVVPVGEELVVTFKYTVSLYTRDWIQQLAAEVHRRLDTLSRHSDTDLPTKTEPETTVDWEPYPIGNLVTKFQQCVKSHPQRLCLTGGDVELSFAQVDEWSNYLASLIEPKLGSCAEERRVVILMDHTPQYVVAIISVLKAGGTVVLLDPTYPSSFLSSVCADANPCMLVVDSSESVPEVLLPRVLVEDWTSNGLPTPDVRPRAYADAAYVIYTSGTTGRMRGVKVGHESVLNLLEGLQQVVYSECPAVERIGLFGSFAFDTSVKQWIQIFAGHTVDVVPSAVRKNVALLSNYITQRVSVLDCTPSYARLILDCLNRTHPDRAMVLLLGGESIGKQLWDDIRESKMIHGWNLYGVTEATVDSAVTPIEGNEPHAGSVLPGQEVLILGDDLVPVVHGAVGEICIAGVGVALGYVHPSHADRQFTVLPDGRRVFRTGDLGRVDERGHLWVGGRLDRQCKVRGQRVELDGIEHLIKAIKGVSEAAAVKPEETECLVVFLVGKQQAQREQLEVEVMALLRERLPDVSVVSNICWLDQMPLTSRGKVDYSVLNQSLSRSERKHVEPMVNEDLDPKLLHVLKLWREVLKQPALGPDDDFFEAGGHSLLAIELVHRLEPYDAMLSMEVFLEARTPRMLSTRLGIGSDSDRSCIVLLRDGGEEPPVFCMHVTGGQVLYYETVARNMPNESPIYGVRSRAVHPGVEEHESYEEMLDTYAREIVQTHPGPYRLLGWCVGGLLALAVGRRIEEMGREVEFIGILDTPFSDVSQENATSNHPLWELYYLFSDTFVACLEKLDPSERARTAEKLRPMDPEQKIRWVKEWAASSGAKIPDVPIDDLLHYVMLARRHTAFLANHRLLPVSAALRLWRAKSSDVPVPDWSTYATDYAEFDATGDHYSMLREANAPSLGQSIASAIKSVARQAMFEDRAVL